MPTPSSNLNDYYKHAILQDRPMTHKIGARPDPRSRLTGHPAMYGRVRRHPPAMYRRPRHFPYPWFKSPSTLVGAVGG
jgi:hypothetical protein